MIVAVKYTLVTLPHMSICSGNEVPNPSGTFIPVILSELLLLFLAENCIFHNGSRPFGESSNIFHPPDGTDIRPLHPPDDTSPRSASHPPGSRPRPHWRSRTAPPAAPQTAPYRTRWAFRCVSAYWAYPASLPRS